MPRLSGGEVASAPSGRGGEWGWSSAGYVSPMSRTHRHLSTAQTSRPEPRPGITPAGTFLPELEGLRGLAILLVLLFHCEGAACYFAARAGGVCTDGPLVLVTAGHTGVSLFFVLSAFLLSMPFFQQRAGERSVSLKRFYQRRALRILPLYFAVLGAGALISPSMSTTLRTLPYLVFVNGIWPVTSPGTHSEVMWSLATEVQFYAVLPWLFMPVGARLRFPMLVGFAVLYTALICGALSRLLGDSAWLIGLSIVGRGPVFLCGILGAWLYVRFSAQARVSRSVAVIGDIALVAAFVALELLLRVVTAGGNFFPWEVAPWILWHVGEGAIWTVVVLLVVIAPLRLRALFTNRVMTRLGVLSYSIYLIHWPLLIWGGGLVLSPLALATGGSALPEMYLLAGLSVGLSAVTYRLIERPFLLRKAHVGDTASRLVDPLPAKRAA